MAAPSFETAPRPSRLLGALEIIASALPDWYPFNLLVSSVLYLYSHRRLPNLSSPKTFNEELLRRKLADDSLSKAFATDKEYVKYFLRGVLGRDCTPKTFRVLEGYDREILDGEFEPCVIKPTNLTGKVIFVFERRRLSDYEKERIRDWLREDHFGKKRERNYKPLKPKIIVEELLLADGQPPEDFKVFCFRGEPKIVQIDMGKYEDHQICFYDLDWKKLDFTYRYELYPGEVGRPAGLDEMIEISASISKMFDFVRVDFYQCGNRVIVGELTFWPGNCNNVFNPRERDRDLYLRYFAT